MRFSEQWREDETAAEEVYFTLEELQAAASATGLDVRAFRALTVFRCLYDVGQSHLRTEQKDSRAIAYMEPLVVAALTRREEARDRRSAWTKAKRFGWQVLDAEGAPVLEPESPGDNW